MKLRIHVISLLGIVALSGYAQSPAPTGESKFQRTLRERREQQIPSPTSPVRPLSASKNKPQASRTPIKDALLNPHKNEHSWYLGTFAQAPWQTFAGLATSTLAVASGMKYLYFDKTPEDKKISAGFGITMGLLTAIPALIGAGSVVYNRYFLGRR